MKSESATPETGPIDGPRSVRLVFSYAGNDVRLVSRQSVRMTPPPSDPVTAVKDQTGFWYEVRDGTERALYRRVVQNPIRFAVEVRSDDPKRPLSWKNVREPRGEFVLVIPGREDARVLVLFSSPVMQKGPAEPVREIARFDLAEGPSGKETT